MRQVWGYEEKIGRGLSASEQVRDPQHSANVISCEGWILRALKLEGTKSDDRRVSGSERGEAAGTENKGGRG